MNIDWGAGPAFSSEEEWSDWQQKARKVCISHHYACQCREARFAETGRQLQRAVSLLQALFDLQNGPPTERRKKAWVEVMGQSVMFMGDMEEAGVVPTEIKPIGGQNGQ